MAARRSAANSPTSSPILLRPPSRSDSLVNAQLRPIASFQRAPVAQRGSTLALANSDSSSESEDPGESESEESAGSSTMRPKRQRTITQKARGRASTELGHLSRPGNVTMPSSSKSALGHGEDVSDSGQSQRPPSGGFFRSRASKSASAVQPNAAARRASQRATDKGKQKQTAAAPAPVSQQQIPAKVSDRTRSKSRARDSDSNDSDSSSDDSDDAPLATFMRPSRPGSAASNASRSRTPVRPLIDISTLGAAPPPLPSLPRSERPSPVPNVPEKSTSPPVPDKDTSPNSSDSMSSSRPTHEAKPSLSDRLARIAQGAGAKSVEQLAAAPPIERRSLDAKPTLAMENNEQGRHPQLARSQTVPLSPSDDYNDSPSPSPSASRPRPALNAAAAYDLTDPKPIIPTPIRERSPPPAFAVTSRPPSQLSLNRLSNSQATVKLLNSPSSSPTTSSYIGDSPSSPSASSVLTDSPISTNKPSPFASTTRIKTSLPPTPSTSASARPSPGGRQRSSTLVPRSTFEASAGFTGGGLLASPAAEPASTKTGSSAPKQSQLPSATRVGRARSSTMLPQIDVSPASRVEIESIAGGSGSSRMHPSASPASAAASTASSSPSHQQTTPHRFPQRPRVPFSSPTSSSGSMSPLQQPSKPFAVSGRGNSPASSTGDSSSGRTPLTPADGSDLGIGESRSAISARNGRRRGPSVTFEDEEKERGRAGSKVANVEERRKERRRSEAKAAIELGKVFNGQITLQDDDEEDMPLNGLGPRMNTAANPMMSLTPPTPVTPWGPAPGSSAMGTPPFLMPPPNADPSFLAAHQHAMMIAKQAYQMAVAQQALAAANEEWERGSSVSAFGGMSMAGNIPGMNPMAGMGMPSMMPGGFGMGYNPMMFSSTQTMYAGSTAGSELGVGWGTRSEYGGPARNSRTSAMFNSRQSAYGFTAGQRSESSGNLAASSQSRPTGRPRTKTSPADSPLPRDYAKNRQGPPPSSFRPL
ncbi:uncharacterized protein PHACADRAFT_248377 [Phanerochaete carnosa HHB-10118-sp]|uniref:Uncharacterized protein n=1 Tax=Phanerochaete carnosa (strain HHB-10118-sp) TaxID=650164 RepID=K5WQW4_PHACS|nr:uncharacterized protein PHACADRAFT_248377 [Phanerochaete carnosa HHB-10118-sp]EKM61649.1 hypothetical protein PHACADRAFT_248377 [Phanerochaete carnosa HHB-10118-sp]